MGCTQVFDNYSKKNVLNTYDILGTDPSRGLEHEQIYGIVSDYICLNVT